MARAPSPRAEADRQRTRSSGGEPWLEEADYEAPATQTLIGRRAALTLIAALLLLVALVGAGLFLVTRRADAPIDVPTGEIPLVASPGPWKVPAEGPGSDGVPVEGQGQIVFPAGEGLEPEAEIDPDRLPEAPQPLPREGPAGAPLDLLPTDEAPAEAESPRPAEVRRAEPAPAAVPKPSEAPPSAGEAAPALPTGTIQLGAFSSEARARATWKEMSARFPWLAGYSPAFLPVEREGQTLYRLRASGPDARSVCDRLRIAGEECALVR